MTPTTVNGIDELRELVGQTIGPSDWREVTQEDIDKFAEVSGDHQWIHVDVERAKTESPFGTTIAHGNLTLCLLDGFRDQLFQSEGFKMGINYGWNKVRFTAPVPSGRAHPRQPRDALRGRGRRRLVPARPEVDRGDRGAGEAGLSPSPVGQAARLVPHPQGPRAGSGR